MNICAVLSQLGRHDLAFHHAQNAIIIVQANLLKAFLPKRDNDKVEHIESNFKDRIAVLAIAYHNLAVEQEFLKMVIFSHCDYPFLLVQ